MASPVFTLDHRWAPPRMSAYVESDLQGRRRRRMERHVALCPVCARKLRALREVVRALAGLRRAAPRPAPDLTAAVLGRLRGDAPAGGGGGPPGG